MIHRHVLTGVMVASLFLAAVTLFEAETSAQSANLVSFDKSWECSGGALCDYDPNNRVWKCSDHLSCGLDDCGYRTQLMADGCWDGKCYGEYQYEFKVPKPGNYTCTVTVTTSQFDHKIGSPQYNEKTDVYLNGEKVGTTSDPWCPDTPWGYDGWEEEDEKDINCIPQYCDEGKYGCKWYYYTWHDEYKGRTCRKSPFCEHPVMTGHTCSSPSPWYKFFPKHFKGVNSPCCGCWIHGTWCGECDPDGGAECGMKENKYCWDVTFGGAYCQGFGPGGVECVWDEKNTVLVGVEGSPEENGITCGEISKRNGNPSKGSYEEKLTNLLSFHHFSGNEYDTNLICCFVKAGTLENGERCVRHSECKSGFCALEENKSKPCKPNNYRRGEEKDCVCAEKPNK